VHKLVVKRRKPVLLNNTSRAILVVLFEHYPDKIRESALATKLSGLPEWNKELAYMVEKKLVRIIRIPNERGWMGTFERVMLSGDSIYSGRAYRITASGIDKLRAGYLSKDADKLSKKQVQVSTPLPSQAAKSCAHKQTKMVDIMPSSSKTISAGIHVVSGGKSNSEFVAFYLCVDCNSVFYREVGKMS
jgi:hypothetical protein